MNKDREEIEKAINAVLIDRQLYDLTRSSERLAIVREIADGILAIKPEAKPEMMICSKDKLCFPHNTPHEYRRTCEAVKEQSYDFTWINKTYDVPAGIGVRVRYTGSKSITRDGVIVGEENSKLLIRLDGDSFDGHYHPTWEIEYLEAKSAVELPEEPSQEYTFSQLVENQRLIIRYLKAGKEKEQK